MDMKEFPAVLSEFNAKLDQLREDFVSAQIAHFKAGPLTLGGETVRVGDILEITGGPAANVGLKVVVYGFRMDYTWRAGEVEAKLLRLKKDGTVGKNISKAPVKTAGGQSRSGGGGFEEYAVKIGSVDPRDIPAKFKSTLELPQLGGGPTLNVSLSEI